MRPITLVVTIEDGKAKQSQIMFNITDLSSTTDLVGQIETAQYVQSLLDSITTGKIVRCGLIVDVDLAVGIKTTAGVNSDVEEGGLFIFNSSIGNNTQVRIPTFDESLLVSGTRTVDLTEVSVTDFVDTLLDGYEFEASEFVMFQDNRGDDITTLRSAREIIGRSRL